MRVLLGCAAVGGSNRAHWCYEPFDKLLNQAVQSSDVAERTKLYQEAQVIFKDQVPWITLAHSTVYMPMSKKVSGYVLDPFGKHEFDTVDVAD
ncbi:MAG: ABC transporter substrate-binding protein, partial [Methylobacteriaceae bacterium]|jgi:dipeptide transport system substrate-binding protein|nr:ABC transporter substrate-binding protein [Methylobacteriaceae bacterium]